MTATTSWPAVPSNAKKSPTNGEYLVDVSDCSTNTLLWEIPHRRLQGCTLAGTVPIRDPTIRSATALLDEFLAGVSFGLLLFDPQARLHFINLPAVEMLNWVDALSAPPDTLSLDSLPNTLLRRQLRHIFRHPRSSHSVYAGRFSHHDIVVLAYTGKSGIYFVLMRGKKLQPSKPILERLRQLYGFTAQEARIASQLSSGCTVEEISACLGIQTNTVRMHLKKIFDKTGTSRQTQLVCHLATEMLFAPLLPPSL